MWLEQSCLVASHMMYSTATNWCFETPEGVHIAEKTLLGLANTTPTLHNLIRKLWMHNAPVKQQATLAADL